MSRLTRIGAGLVMLVVGALAWGEEGRGPAGADPAAYDAYVGRYALTPTQPLEISRFRTRLYLSLSGPCFPISPESETRFSYQDKDLGFRVTFRKDDAGRVVGLLFERGKVHVEARKVSDVPYEAVVVPEVFDSPRIAALAAGVKGGDGAAVEEFWKEIRDKAPLVESLAGDERSSWVTFVYRGDAATGIVVLDGGPVAASDDARGPNLTHLAGTDVWYRTVRVPTDARFAYTFEVNVPARLPDDPATQRKLYHSGMRGDSLNPRSMDVLLGSGSGYPVWSVVELPGAPAQPYLRSDPGTAKGTVSRQKMRSEALKQERTFAVYVPPGYEADGEPCTLVVLFDGDMYHSEAMIPGATIMDNLIAARRIPKAVAVFVDSADRAKELHCSEAFATFVAKELVPWVRGRYHVSPEAGRTVAGGASLGGVMASYCALKHPDVFGNVLSQSGAYWVYPGCFDEGPKPAVSGGGWLAGEFVRAGRVPVRFYLEAGRFENDGPDDLLGENRRFRDVLLAKGYDVSYAEFSGGHHFVSWRGSFADALIALTAPVGQR